MGMRGVRVIWYCISPNKAWILFYIENYTFWLGDRLCFSFSVIITREFPRKSRRGIKFFNTIPSQAWYYISSLKFHLQNYKLFQIKAYIMIPFTFRVFKHLSEPLWYDMMMMVIRWLIDSWAGIMITYKKDNQYLFFNNLQKQKLWWEKGKYHWTAQSHWCWGDLHRVLLNCQNKLARLGALSQQGIKLHALNVTFFCAAFF